ncbi:MAG: hypothetical protein P4L83_12150 [Nevskia sp.]|nr:hypothetical protein [Nevskia sp.]
MRLRLGSAGRVPAVAALAMAVVLAQPAEAAPRLYSQPAYQSPVRAEPDDLLLLPGDGLADGDSVVYQILPDTTRVPPPPDRVPDTSDAASGLVPVVSYASVPYSLTVKLPQVLRSGQSYVLRVRNRLGEWSNAVAVNDARPLWFTPAYVYATAAAAGLPRELKVVGRNLQAAPGAHTLVRLNGPQKLTLTAAGGDRGASALDRYVAKVSLPALKPGHYRLELSRDGVSWLTLPDRLDVRPDPAPAPVFAVDDPAYGGCRPDDGVDDTPCILRAIDAARMAGSGTVRFGPGVWDLAGGGAAVDAYDGIVVPAGVGLSGAGARLSRIVRHEDWDRGATQPVFTLTGKNTVQGLTFADAKVHQPGDPFMPTLLLGKVYYRVGAGEPRNVDDVAIVRNVFDKVYLAVEDGGLPISRLLVAANVFGAYANDLELAGNRFNMVDKFRFDDSAIVHNLFQPGSYLDTAKKTGVTASEIGASYHLDFSGNVADGASTDYLYSPDDARGWRAAFFWHMNNSHEMSLISENVATCTGDKIGDGEAIAYDNNANTFAFDKAREVLEATPDSVTVAGPLQRRQNDRDVPLDRYYVGHWIQVGQGRGIGQVRRIESYRIGPSGTVTFKVSPAWDVVPEAGRSRISVGREFWQVYALANRVDQRRPLCQKSNRSQPKGGVIGLWAQTSDSVVEGNLQNDTDGILFLQSYSAADPGSHEFGSWSFFQSFLEIRDNRIDGEYDWDSDCSSSGIQGALSASPTPAAPPPTAGYGVTIAHNTVTHADSVHGGGISLPLAWYAGPPPNKWRLVDNVLIHHNVIEDVSGTAPRKRCQADASGRRVGISLGHAMIWHAALYANSCRNVSAKLVDEGSHTLRICPSDAGSEDCECFEIGRDDPVP